MVSLPRCGSLCHLRWQQPTGLTLPCAPAGVWGRVPVAQSSRRALAAPAARSLPTCGSLWPLRGQVSWLLNHSHFPDGRAHGFAAPHTGPLPPSVATGAGASLRATGTRFPPVPKPLCSIFRERCRRQGARNAALPKIRGFQRSGAGRGASRARPVDLTRRVRCAIIFNRIRHERWRAPAGAVHPQTIQKG